MYHAYCAIYVPSLHHHHPSTATTTTTTLPTYSFFPVCLIDGQEYGSPRSHIGLAERAIIGPIGSHTQALAPSVVGRIPKSKCSLVKSPVNILSLHLLHWDSRVLNVSSVANVGIAVALHTENCDSTTVVLVLRQKYLSVTGRSAD